MDIPEHIGTYTTEHIIEHTTDGVDEWGATRKERITRCADCIHWWKDEVMGDGYCKGRHKYATGFCDEAIRRT